MNAAIKLNGTARVKIYACLLNGQKRKYTYMLCVCVESFLMGIVDEINRKIIMSLWE